MTSHLIGRIFRATALSVLVAALIAPILARGATPAETAPLPPLLGISLPPQQFFPPSLQLLASNVKSDPKSVLKTLKGRRDPHASLLRGYAEILAGQPAEALQSFTQARAHRSSEPYALYGEAMANKSLGNLSKALILAKDALWFRGKSTAIQEAPFLCLIGYLEIATGKAAQGMETLKKALKADPSNPSTLYLLANLPSHDGPPEQRTALLKTALQSPEFISLDSNSKRTLELSAADAIVSGVNRRFGKNDLEQALSIATKYHGDSTIGSTERIQAASIAVRAHLAKDQIQEARKLLRASAKEWPHSQTISNLESQVAIELAAHKASEETGVVVDGETKKEGPGKSRPSHGKKKELSKSTDTAPKRSPRS